MSDLSAELGSLLFAADLSDIDRGWLLQTPVSDACFAEATNLIARCPEHTLRTLVALHLTIAPDLGVSVLATADVVMADAAASMNLQVARL